MKKNFGKFCLLLVGSIFGGVTTGAVVVAGNWMLAGAAMLLHVAALIKIADMYYQLLQQFEQSEINLQEARASNEVYRAAMVSGNLTCMAVAAMQVHQAKPMKFGKGSSDVSGG